MVCDYCEDGTLGAPTHAQRGDGMMAFYRCTCGSVMTERVTRAMEGWDEGRLHRLLYPEAPEEEEVGDMEDIGVWGRSLIETIDRVSRKMIALGLV